MPKHLLLTLAAAVAGSCVPLVSHADMGDSPYEVGTSIYSPGPLIPMHSFHLTVKMKPEPMRVMQMDMQKMHTITCRVLPVKTSNDTALLSCTPGQ